MPLQGVLSLHRESAKLDFPSTGADHGSYSGIRRYDVTLLIEISVGPKGPTRTSIAVFSSSSIYLAFIMVETMDDTVALLS